MGSLHWRLPIKSICIFNIERFRLLSELIFSISFIDIFIRCDRRRCRRASGKFTRNIWYRFSLAFGIECICSLGADMLHPVPDVPRESEVFVYCRWQTRTRTKRYNLSRHIRKRIFLKIFFCFQNYNDYVVAMTLNVSTVNWKQWNKKQKPKPTHGQFGPS